MSPGGEHAVESAVLVGNRQRGERGLLAQYVPRAPDSHAGGQRGRRVEIEIAHLSAHCVYAHGRLEAEFLQHELRLIADFAQPRGDVFALAQRVLERGIGHCRDDRVGIRIFVACNIDGFHGIKKLLS